MNDTHDIWQSRLTELMQTLTQAVAESRWSDAAESANELLTLLHAAPAAADPGDRRKTLEAVQAIVATLLENATLARDETAEELRLVGRGRKAVNAYT